MKTYLKYNPGVYCYHDYRWYSDRRNEPFYAPTDEKIPQGKFYPGDCMDLDISAE